MQDTDLNVIAARMHQVLEHDYAYLVWRVLVQAESGAGATAEPWLFVHTRTSSSRVVPHCSR